jgi:hypothetical protein
MKPSSEYWQKRPATLEDFVQYLNALCGIPLLPGVPETDIHSRIQHYIGGVSTFKDLSGHIPILDNRGNVHAMKVGPSAWDSLEAAILTGGPLPDWLEAAKAEYLAKPIGYVEDADEFMFRATEAAEHLIEGFKILYPSPTLKTYKGELEDFQARASRQGDGGISEGDRRAFRRIEAGGTFTPSEHGLDAVRWRAGRYGRYILYPAWLEAQIKALEAPATPPPAHEPPTPPPVFTPEAQKAILEALKHLAPDGGAKLADLLAGGAVGPVAFSGNTKGLAVLMRNVYRLGHIGGVDKTALAEWLHRSFGFGGKVALNTLKDYVLKPAKAPDERRYRIPIKLVQKK